jgi:hypothetical protein
MHASKDSIWREIYCSFVKFSGSKLGPSLGHPCPPPSRSPLFIHLENSSDCARFAACMHSPSPGTSIFVLSWAPLHLHPRWTRQAVQIQASFPLQPPLEASWSSAFLAHWSPQAWSAARSSFLLVREIDLACLFCSALFSLSLHTLRHLKFGSFGL